MKDKEVVVEKKERKERRAGRKRMLKPPPKFALPVRTLWELASEEQKARAHMAGIAILEHWTGRITKVEAAKRLGIPTLRIWQLSQQATSGMLAGLLVQPKTRARGVPVSPNEDPKALLKRIEKLEQTIRQQEMLIQVLRTMPGCRDVSMPMEAEEKSEAREVPTGARSQGRKNSGERGKK
jgi:hypothetical protein